MKVCQTVCFSSTEIWSQLLQKQFEGRLKQNWSIWLEMVRVIDGCSVSYCSLPQFVYRGLLWVESFIKLWLMSSCIVELLKILTGWSVHTWSSTQSSTVCLTVPLTPIVSWCAQTQLHMSPLKFSKTAE